MTALQLASASERDDVLAFECPHPFRYLISCLASFPLTLVTFQASIQNVISLQGRAGPIDDCHSHENSANTINLVQSCLTCALKPIKLMPHGGLVSCPLAAPPAKSDPTLIAV